MVNVHKLVIYIYNVFYKVSIIHVWKLLDQPLPMNFLWQFCIKPVYVYLFYIHVIYMFYSCHIDKKWCGWLAYNRIFIFFFFSQIPCSRHWVRYEEMLIDSSQKYSTGYMYCQPAYIFLHNGHSIEYEFALNYALEFISIVNVHLYPILTYLTIIHTGWYKSYGI